jgi:hypothetical protein
LGLLFDEKRGLSSRVGATFVEGYHHANPSQLDCFVNMTIKELYLLGYKDV